MSTVLPLDPKQVLAMAPYTRDAACVEAIVERRETYEAQVKRIAKDRLKAKLSMLDPKDLCDAAFFNPKKHGAALRAAWQESAEALGDFVMSVIVHELQLQCEIEAAQVVERIEGAEPVPERKPLHTFIRIVGEV